MILDCKKPTEYNCVGDHTWTLSRMTEMQTKEYWKKWNTAHLSNKQWEMVYRCAVQRAKFEQVTLYFKKDSKIVYFVLVKII